MVFGTKERRWIMTKLQDLMRGYEPGKVYLPAWLDRLGSLGIVSTDPCVT